MRHAPRYLLGCALLGIVFYCLNAAQPNFSAYAAALNKARAEKNRAFRQSADSPLSTAQKAQFDSLKHYPAQSGFAITATVSRNATPDTVLLPMSDNRTEKYLRWGQVQFKVDDKPLALRLYLKATGTDSTLFVPFTDLTNGRDTYGGGRYLDVPVPKRDAETVELDFNRAYSPYCAYNNAYSCPVPPADNRLTVPIPAGEKAFHD